MGQVFTNQEPDSTRPSDPNYETEFKARLDSILNNRTFVATSGNAGVDEGKLTWPRLLAELYKARNNQSALTTLINGTGNNLLNSQWAGSFCGPFSIPGYTMYCFSWRGLMPAAQNTKADSNMLKVRTFPRRCQPSSGWALVSRPDGYMDPILTDPSSSNYNLNGSEFNSENYHWMQRMSGYLWAQHLQDTARQTYYDTFIRNWVRALYNSGRIEWNSNNYWPHTINPLLMLHAHATNTEHKKMARAGLDAMFTETALHYLDNFHVAGADPRAKTIAYRPTSFLFNYLYYTTSAQPGSWQRDFSNRPAATFDDVIGFAPYSTYRPAQQLLDIAHRNFSMPVEIRSAKPYYRADYRQYAGWKGDSTQSRRNEFETLWLDYKCSMGSVATLRPTGTLGTFSEQSLWRIAAEGTNGPVQLCGNAGTMTQSAGRCADEEIAQFRNVLLRQIKNEDSLWVGIPNTLTPTIVADTLYLDMGNGVYVAFKPFGGHNGIATRAMPADPNYTQYVWTHTLGNVFTLATEIGTSATYSSFAGFQQQVSDSGSFTSAGVDAITYTSSQGAVITMQYNPTTVYNLECAIGAQTTVSPAGVLPGVVANGEAIDYNTWQVYEVVYGEDIIRQNWGSGVLDLRAAGKGLKITAADVDGTITYQTYDAAPTVITDLPTSLAKTIGKGLCIFPNPASASATSLGLFTAFIHGQVIKSITVYNATGKQQKIKSTTSTLTSGANSAYNGISIMPDGVLIPGIYLVRAVTQSGYVATAKLIID